MKSILRLSFVILSMFSSNAEYYTAKQLPYAYDALEPHISSEIINVHYEKHYKGYVSKLNKTIGNHRRFSKRPLTWLLKNTQKVPASICQKVIDFGGGVYNHELYFDSMRPNGKQKPTGKLLKKIEKTFGSFDAFKKQFSDQAQKLFGSGWVWLCADENGKLSLLSTINQNSPLDNTIFSGPLALTPLLTIDVWEHAYYLQYKNKRSDYITAWWKVIDWAIVEKRYKKLGV